MEGVRGTLDVQVVSLPGSAMPLLHVPAALKAWMPSSHLWKAHFWQSALCISPWAASLGRHSSSFCRGWDHLHIPRNHFLPGFSWSSEVQSLPGYSFSITHKEGSQWVLLATPQPTSSSTAPLGAHFPTAFGPQLLGKKLSKYVSSQLRVAASSWSCYSKTSLVFFSPFWPIAQYSQQLFIFNFPCLYYCVISVS